MIFNNFVDNGTVLTSTIWNRAWGFEGTAKSLYDLVGAQQYASNIYGAFSWLTVVGCGDCHRIIHTSTLVSRHRIQ